MGRFSYGWIMIAMSILYLVGADFAWHQSPQYWVTCVGLSGLAIAMAVMGIDRISSK